MLTLHLKVALNAVAHHASLEQPTKHETQSAVEMLVETVIHRAVYKLWTKDNVLINKDSH